MPVDPLGSLPEGFSLDPHRAVSALPEGFTIDETKPMESATDALSRFGRGAVRGLRDPIDAGAQLLARGLEAVAPAGSGFEQWAKGQRQETEAVNRGAEQDYQANWRDGKTGFDPGRLAGNMIASAPLFAAAGPSVAGGIAAGAASGALQPVDTANNPDQNFWTEKAKQAAISGAVGGGANAALGGLARVIQPKSSPQIQQLIDAGVTPTPGQMLGGAAQRVEEGLTSVPLLGDVIKGAQTRSLESFNRATVNKVLEPIGEKLSAATPVGREAIEEAGKKISAAYNEILPGLVAKADQPFIDQIGNLRTLAADMPADKAAQFERIITNKLLSRFNPQTGTISGEVLKQAESALGGEASLYRRSLDPDHKKLGDAVREAQAALRDLVQRSNPEVADRLSAINESYAMQLRLENAASRAGSKDGVFTPNALDASARALDGSLRKRAFARGDALMQDLAEAGQSVLGSKVPDSGTGFRAMTMAGLPAIAAHMDPAAGAGVALGMLPYSSIGQNAIVKLLGSRPELAEPLSQAVRRLGPVAGSAGAGAFQSVLNRGP